MGGAVGQPPARRAVGCIPAAAALCEPGPLRRDGCAAAGRALSGGGGDFYQVLLMQCAGARLSTRSWAAAIAASGS